LYGFSNTAPGYLSGQLCVPAETRTLGPLIKSQLLYQLSYGNIFCGGKCNGRLPK
jgi:hypothetical protein